MPVCAAKQQLEALHHISLQHLGAWCRYDFLCSDRLSVSCMCLSCMLASPNIMPCYFHICTGYGALHHDDSVLLTTDVSIRMGGFLEHRLQENKWSSCVMQEWGSQACFVLRWAPRQSPSLTMTPRLSGLASAKHLYMHAYAAILPSSPSEEMPWDGASPHAEAFLSAGQDACLPTHMTYSHERDKSCIMKVSQTA